MSMRARTSSQWVAQALVDLVTEPFATCEDVDLDVRRVDRLEAETHSDGQPGLVVELADGSVFELRIERVA